MSNPPRRQRGFTLLEVLLVVALAAMVSVGIVLNVDLADDSRKLEREAERFMAVIELVSEQALMEGVEYGFQIEENRYQFYYLDDADQWQPVPEDRLMRPYQVPEPYQLELTLDDLPWQEEQRLTESGGLFEELEIGEDEERFEPQVMLFSSGELTPFALSWAADALTEPAWIVTGKMHGMVELLPAGEAP